MEGNLSYINKKLDKFHRLNGSQLKYIAFVSMLIDHVNNALVTPFLTGEGFLVQLSNLFSFLGRLAFPIFIFLLVEGFFKTKSRKKYFFNLFAAALVSEIPFNLFTSKTIFQPYWNNVLFTLALALLTLWVIDELKGRLDQPGLWVLASLVIVGLSSGLAMFLSLDYDAHAIIIAYLFYVFYSRPLLATGLAYLSIIKEWPSIFGFALTLMYNSQRGRQYKWVNYLFYPVHLLIIAGLRYNLNV